MRINNKITGKYSNYIFLFLLILFYLILDFQSILFMQPQGIHFMRQTDSLSFAANYYKNGFHFFNPQVFNLTSINGNAACEFPLLYYISAIFYLIFGEHDFILRLITLVIASTGFFFLFKMLKTLFKDTVYAMAFTFLFISSTVLLYYTNNYLPDASALGFTLIGWYFYYRFFENRQSKKYLFLCFMFFALASLLKITYFINPAAAFASLIIFDFYSKARIKGTFRKNLITTLVFTFSILLVLGWNLYAIYYNKINHDKYFLTHIAPVWNMETSHIKVVIDYVNNYWYTKYYYQSTFHAYLILIFFGFIFIRKSDIKMLIPAIILLGGSICFCLLFFAQFRDHDYYFITLIPLIIFIVSSSFVAIRNKFPLIINHFITKLAFISLCVLSLNYGREKLSQRYGKTDDSFANIGFKLHNTKAFLDSLNIPENAKFIVITDQTPNGGLYFINRPGWTLKDTTESSIAEMNNYIKQGAEYILFTEKQYVINTLKGKIIGEDNGVLLYKIE